MIVEINGNPLDVELLGDDPQAPLLIAHHGAPGLGSKREPLAAFGHLADIFRVLVFDARGSGKSGDTPPFTHEQWVADIDALREWAGAERFVMAGGSYGGFLSMEYAIAHPDRLLALVLRDTAPDQGHDELALANARASARVEIDDEKLMRIMEGRVRDNDDFRDCWAEILPLYDFDFDPATLPERIASVDYHYATHNYAFSVNRHAYDVKPGLPGVSCPTLVTVGRADWITPVECSETIAELIPDSELVIFEKSGHSPPLEEPELFQSVVRRFLTERVLTAGR
ncbi:alpha/beta fold hydrolase [Phytoactinopolyspora halotolerans]|uniref:Alpha/beta hydrolase n=1 Tax=Phytoactinopolyspora halotolerans TaxID=1981512 RepID=A0A6L9S8N8_9ACTN|nr:alpha/beta hydrolase [Phytoactinopolyspora halotolerans]NEE00330.1 alpha/beta hydrolase [Phytoactinopolyspora halotolerans]